MTTGSEWRDAVGRSWADNYRLTDRTFSGLTERLLTRIRETGGHFVLDVGCGAGELSLAVARNDHGTQVVGVDVSADLIRAARQRGEALVNARFEEADAGSWSEPGFAPDLLISRHGVMFFDAPRSAFGHLRGIAQGGAALIFSCFRDRKLNPWASELGKILELSSPADPTAPGPFAFSDEAYVRSILGDAGWQHVALEAVDFAYIAGSGDDPVDDALHLFSRIGPAAPALRALEGAERERALGWMRDWLEQHRSGSLVALPASAWIVTARA